MFYRIDPSPEDCRVKEHQLKRRLGTLDLLVKAACFVKKVNNIFNIKVAKEVNRTEAFHLQQGYPGRAKKFLIII
jgi:hypothetical protein